MDEQHLKSDNQTSQWNWIRSKVPILNPIDRSINRLNKSNKSIHERLQNSHWLCFMDYDTILLRCSRAHILWLRYILLINYVLSCFDKGSCEKNHMGEQPWFSETIVKPECLCSELNNLDSINEMLRTVENNRMVITWCCFLLILLLIQSEWIEQQLISSEAFWYNSDNCQILYIDCNITIPNWIQMSQSLIEIPCVIIPGMNNCQPMQCQTYRMSRNSLASDLPVSEWRIWFISKIRCTSTRIWAILNFQNPANRLRKRSLPRVNAERDAKLIFWRNVATQFGSFLPWRRSPGRRYSPEFGRSVQREGRGRRNDYVDTQGNKLDKSRDSEWEAIKLFHQRHSTPGAES
jgi:hypothetical protein